MYQGRPKYFSCVHKMTKSMTICTELFFESDDIYVQRNTGNKCFKSNTALKYTRWPDYGSLCTFKTSKV